MSKTHDRTVDSGVAVLDDESVPLGERVQRLVDSHTDDDARAAVVEYGTRMYERDVDDRRLEALVRLARKHGFEVAKADFRPDEATGDDPEPSPAAASDIVVEPLDAQDGCIAVGEKLDLEVQLHNLSGYQDERPVRLVVDDELVHEVDAVLDGGETGEISYMLWFDAPGDYHVEIGGGESVDIEVLQPSSRAEEACVTEDDESVPVNVRSTGIFGRSRDPDGAENMVAESGGGSVTTENEPGKADIEPIEADRCEFLFSDDESVPDDMNDAGLVVVDGERYLAVIQLGTEPIRAVIGDNRRSLRSYVQPFLSGLEFETEIVEVPTRVAVPTPTIEPVDQTEKSDADPITVALSECREVLAGSGTDQRSETKYFVVFQLDSTAVGSDGFVSRGRLKEFLSTWMSSRDRTVQNEAVQELDDRVNTIKEVLRPVDITVKYVSSQQTVREVLARGSGIGSK